MVFENGVKNIQDATYNGAYGSCQTVIRQYSGSHQTANMQLLCT